MENCKRYGAHVASEQTWRVQPPLNLYWFIDWLGGELQAVWRQQSRHWGDPPPQNLYWFIDCLGGDCKQYRTPKWLSMGRTSGSHGTTGSLLIYWWARWKLLAVRRPRGHLQGGHRGVLPQLNLYWFIDWLGGELQEVWRPRGHPRADIGESRHHTEALLIYWLSRWKTASGKAPTWSSTERTLGSSAAMSTVLIYWLARWKTASRMAPMWSSTKQILESPATTESLLIYGLARWRTASGTALTWSSTERTLGSSATVSTMLIDWLID